MQSVLIYLLGTLILTIAENSKDKIEVFNILWNLKDIPFTYLERLPLCGHQWILDTNSKQKAKSKF